MPRSLNVAKFHYIIVELYVGHLMLRHIKKSLVPETGTAL